MFERMEIGSSPYNEECAQVGTDNYSEVARRECKAFIGQLYRTLESNGIKRDELPEGFSLITKGSSHDFGTYYEVVCKFNSEDERSWDLYSYIDDNCPEMWDSIALKELGIERSEAA